MNSRENEPPPPYSISANNATDTPKPQTQPAATEAPTNLDSDSSSEETSRRKMMIRLAIGVVLADVFALLIANAFGYLLGIHSKNYAETWIGSVSIFAWAAVDIMLFVSWVGITLKHKYLAVIPHWIGHFTGAFAYVTILIGILADYNLMGDKTVVIGFVFVLAWIYFAYDYGRRMWTVLGTFRNHA